LFQRACIHYAVIICFCYSAYLCMWTNVCRYDLSRD